MPENLVPGDGKPLFLACRRPSSRRAPPTDSFLFVGRSGREGELCTVSSSSYKDTGAIRLGLMTLMTLFTLSPLPKGPLSKHSDISGSV